MAAVDKASRRAHRGTVRKTLDPRPQLHHLENNLAAIRLWLTMLAESSCAKCRRVQAEGVSAIDRNLVQAQDTIGTRRMNGHSRRRARRKPAP